MARGVLLDSSVVIPHLRGRLDLAAQIAPDEPLFLPLTALGELYKGAFKSSQPQKNRLLLETFLKTVALLHPDTATAVHYAQIRAGSKMGQADLPFPFSVSIHINPI